MIDGRPKNILSIIPRNEIPPKIKISLVEGTYFGKVATRPT